MGREGHFLEFCARERDPPRQSSLSHRGAEYDSQPQKQSLEMPVFKNRRPRLPGRMIYFMMP